MKKTKLFALIMLPLAALILTFSIILYDSGYDIHLTEEYGIDRTTTGILADNYSYNEAKTKYAHYVGWCEYAGWTEREVLALREFVVGWNDAVWSKDNDYSNGCQSRVNVTAPHGTFMANQTMLIAFGHYRGGGTGGGGSQGSTKIIIDHDNWVKGDERHAMATIAAGITWDGGNNYSAYVESFKVEGFRIDGALGSEWYNPNIRSSGFLCWGAGENTDIDRMFFEGCNDFGLEITGGTPINVGNISSFRNNLGGVGLIGGGGLNTYNFEMISGDDNPTLIMVRDGWDGDPGGGNLNVQSVKSETGKRPQDGDRGQIILDAQGVALNANFQNVWAIASYQFLDAPFVLDIEGKRSVKVQQGQLKGFRSLVADVKHQKRYYGIGEYESFEFSLNGDGTFYCDRNWQVGDYFADDRLGISFYDGTQFEPYDYINGTPEYSYTGEVDPGPDPDPCVWTCGEWGPCVDGMQTRTCTPSPAECVGDNPYETSQSCEVIPPPPGNGPAVLLVYPTRLSPEMYIYMNHYSEHYDITPMEFNFTGGENGAATDAKIAELRSAIDSDHPETEWIVFMDEEVFRAGITSGFYGHNSINGAASLGVRHYAVGCQGGAVGPLRESPFYGYTGNTPETDLGFRGASLLSWEAFNKNKDNFKGVYRGNHVTMINDNQRSQDFRKPEMIEASQMDLPDGFSNTLIDNTGMGSSNSWVRNEADIVNQITGINIMKYEDENTYLDGGIFSNVTSYGGCLNGQTPQYQDVPQTLLSEMFQWGYAAGEATIREPWICGWANGDIGSQFIDPVMFVEAYYSGMSIQQILHYSVKKIDLTLFYGDPLFIPYDGDYEPPPPVYGCTDPDCDNYDPDATEDDGSCTGCEVIPPPGGVIWAMDLTDSDGCDIGGIENRFVEYCGEVDGDGLIISHYNHIYDCRFENVTRVTISWTETTSTTNKYLLTTEEYRMFYNQGTTKLYDGVTKYPVEHSYAVPGEYGAPNTITVTFDTPQTVIEIFGPNPMEGRFTEFILE